MEVETIGRKEFEGHAKLCGEKFQRNSDDIDDNSEAIERLTTLVTQMAVMQKTSMEQTKDQETRIRTLEQKGGAWLDRLMSLGLGAAITYIVSRIFPH